MLYVQYAPLEFGRAGPLWLNTLAAACKLHAAQAAASRGMRAAVCSLIHTLLRGAHRCKPSKVGLDDCASWAVAVIVLFCLHTSLLSSTIVLMSVCFVCEGFVVASCEMMMMCAAQAHRTQWPVQLFGSSKQQKEEDFFETCSAE